jgi:hypothetical protein
VLVVAGATVWALTLSTSQDASDVAEGFADGSEEWEQDFISDASGATGVDEILSYAMPPDGSAVIVTLRSAENITEGLTKDSARFAIVGVLEAAAGAPLPDEVATVSIEVVHPLVDGYGEVTEQRVVLARFDRSTIGRIQFDTIDRAKIFTLANELWVHPAFAKGDGT